MMKARNLNSECPLKSFLFSAISFREVTKDLVLMEDLIKLPAVETTFSLIKKTIY